MKYLLLLWLATSVSMISHAQEESEEVPEGFTGYYEIVLGARLSSIRKFLEPKPVFPYSTQCEIDAAGEKNPTEEDWGKKRAYLVKKSETKFYTYMGATVDRFEVIFDDSNKVDHIRILIKKSDDNKTKIHNGSMIKFGQAACSMSPENESFYCAWWHGEFQYSIGDFDAHTPEPMEYEKEIYIYVDFTYQ